MEVRKITNQEAQESDQDSEASIYLAEFPNTWGSSESSMEEAIVNAMKHWHEYGIRDDGKVKLWMARVSDDFQVSGYDGSVRASKIENDQEVWIDAELVKLAQGVDTDLNCILECMVSGSDPEFQYMNYLEDPRN